MNLLDALREGGLNPRLASNPPNVLEIDEAGRTHRFQVVQRSRAPYPNEIEALRRSASRIRPLLLAPYVSANTGKMLAAQGWSWADNAGNFEMRAKGLWLRQRTSNPPPPRQPRGVLPRGSGSFSVIRRVILGPDHDWTATRLAEAAAVSQPRASQILHKLEKLELVDRVQRRWRARSPDLLDTFIGDYPGPGGSDVPLYGDSEPSEIAIRLFETFDADVLQLAISADVGPDLIAPWRRPSMLVVYASAPFPLAHVQLVPAHGRSDANVLLRVPSDRSVFNSDQIQATFKGHQLALVDAIQMIWDLHDLGGDDRIEAADRLRQWLLNKEEGSHGRKGQHERGGRPP